jgi:hypothetical protein
MQSPSPEVCPLCVRTVWKVCYGREVDHLELEEALVEDKGGKVLGLFGGRHVLGGKVVGDEALK